MQINGKFLIRVQVNETESDVEEVVRKRVAEAGLRGKINNARKVVIVLEKGIVNFVI